MIRHDPHARHAGAREAAVRLLYGPDGIARSWPEAANHYRHALLELVAATDELLEAVELELTAAAAELEAGVAGALEVTG